MPQLTDLEAPKPTVRRISPIGAPRGHTVVAVAAVRPIPVLPEYVVCQFGCCCGYTTNTRESLEAHLELAAAMSAKAVR